MAQGKGDRHLFDELAKVPVPFSPWHPPPKKVPVPFSAWQHRCSQPCGRSIVTKTRYGVLAAIAGAAIGAWWWRSRSATRPSFDDKGVVIFDNTPVASSANGVL
jgi:hypothetical protein